MKSIYQTGRKIPPSSYFVNSVFHLRSRLEEIIDKAGSKV